MGNEMLAINRDAHLETRHPGSLPWPDLVTAEEARFCSRFVFGTPGRERDAMLYVAKELAQLSEIEKHVSATMAMLLADLADEEADWAAGYGLHDALSCFAAEELQHADMFYRYVRLLLQDDFKVKASRIDERVAIYRGDRPFLPRLAALVAGAYVGESVMTVFQNRIRSLDPHADFFITKVIDLHARDEARHVQFDHLVFDRFITGFVDEDRALFSSMLKRQLEMNREMSIRFEEQMSRGRGDYTRDNQAHHVQKQLLETFAAIVFANGRARHVDDVVSDELKDVIRGFSGSQTIHPAAVAA